MSIRDKKFYVTYFIIGINAIITLIMFLYDSSFGVYTLIEFGAKYNPMIAAGQYHRLITAMFLHADVTHLLFNMYALHILGKNIEIIFGKVKFIGIFVISGLFGTLGSFIFSDAVSVGASGAIFGLTGAYLYLYFKNPDIFYKKQFYNLITMIGINLLLGIVIPNIDNFAHVWGLIGGFIVSWSLGVRGESLRTKNRILALALTFILIITSFGAGIKLNQDTWQYNLFKGIEFLKKNEIDNAQKQFTQGIAKNDDVEDFHYYLGQIFYTRNDPEKATQYFERALAINPNFEEARLMLEKVK